MGDSDVSLGKLPSLVTGRPSPLHNPLCVHGWSKAHGTHGHLKGSVGDCRVGQVCNG